MKIIKEANDNQFAVVLIGGSIGEKKYYGLKYVVAEVENGKYTGK